MFHLECGMAIFQSLPLYPEACAIADYHRTQLRMAWIHWRTLSCQSSFGIMVHVEVGHQLEDEAIVLVSSIPMFSHIKRYELHHYWICRAIIGTVSVCAVLCNHGRNSWWDLPFDLIVGQHACQGCCIVSTYSIGQCPNDTVHEKPQLYISRVEAY